MKNYLKQLTPNTLLWILFGLWWAINLLQAGFTELADDEGYYFMFARELAWGYFDHPPMTALLVKLGSIFGGEFGIRFFFTILQPLYLIMLFHIIKPREGVCLRDVTLFAVICAGIPIMQLYGFIAMPDAPLMFFSALFLLVYKRFTESNRIIDAILLGVTMAALAYSKYHGALVVAFTLMTNPRILRNPKLYLAGAVTIVLILPHLWWQYCNNWASFDYHLSGRNGIFQAKYLREYLVNILLIFNPLFFPIYIKAWIKTKAQNPAQRAILFMIPAFILFFCTSTLRGYVQPQWIIPSTFGFITLLWLYAMGRERLRKYVMWAGVVTIFLVMLFRAEMIFNPLGLHHQVFDNHATYQAIHNAAQGRPIVFAGRYDRPAKYVFYTGDDRVSTLPDINYRISQWTLWDKESAFEGKTVVLETYNDPDSVIMLANGKSFSYKIVDDFRPIRKLAINILSSVPQSVVRGKSVDFDIEITNPYSYDVRLSPDSLAVTFAMRRFSPDNYNEIVIPQIDTTLCAGSTIRYTVAVEIPMEIKTGENKTGFTIKSPIMGYWFNSKTYKIEVQ